MDPFELFIKIFPLYLVILAGYLGGKFLKIDNKSVSQVILYLVSPVVFFNAMYTVDLSFSTLSIPILFFFLCVIISAIFYYINGFFWKDSTRNILAFSAAWGNVGYYGLPVSIALLGQESANLVIVTVIGFSLFFSTFGFFLTAKGNFTTKEAIKKVLTTPYLPAIILGVILNYLLIDLGKEYTDLANSFKGAYSVLGIMITGFGISKLQKIEIDWKFLSISFIAKFLIWPALTLAIIYLDKTFFNIYTSDDQIIYKVMIVLSLVPMGSNVVALATEFDTQPEKVSTAVVLSSIFALFYIPLMVGLLINLI